MKIKRLKFHVIPLLTIIILANSFFIIESSALSYSNPSTTPLWSYSTGKQFISAVAISDDGCYITAASESRVTKTDKNQYGKLYLFNNSISKEKSPLWNYSIVNDFSSLAISSNGSYIIAGGGYSDRIVYLFNNSIPTPKWTYIVGGWVYDVAISDDDNYFAAASGPRHEVFLFKSTENLLIKRYFTPGLTLRVVLSSDGSYMVVTDNAANLYFFNTSKNSHEWTLNFPVDLNIALSISADGNYIVASGGDKVYLFNKNSSIPLWNYSTPDEIRSIKLSQDGNYFVAGGGFIDKKLYLFNLSNPSPEWTYSTKGEIESVAISFNGDYIVALSTDNFIYLFNKSSSIPIWRYRLDGYPTANGDYSLDMSSDGKYIVAGGRHRIYLFNRDIINAPKLIIPGYNLFYMFLMIGIMLLISVISFFLNYKKIQRKRSI